VIPTILGFALVAFLVVFFVTEYLIELRSFTAFFWTWLILTIVFVLVFNHSSPFSAGSNFITAAVLERLPDLWKWLTTPLGG